MHKKVAEAAFPNTIVAIRSCKLEQLEARWQSQDLLETLRRLA